MSKAKHAQKIISFYCFACKDYELSLVIYASRLVPFFAASPRPYRIATAR
jgi:hypothetical protein